MARLKSAQFDDRLTLVEHLDELRTRIIVCAVVLVLAVAFCFWQNHALLELANEPLPSSQPEPITFSPTEPFFTTVKLAFYGGILLALPILLYQIYAFVLPAFSPREKQIALPAMLGIPFLFIGGVIFGYFTVVPSAIRFLQNFNTDAFDVLIQAQPYYKFVIMLLGAMGLLFQIPIGIVAVTRVGIVTTSQLAHNRRYAILVIAVLAMLLPGQDPVTMSLMMAPMYVLFEGSILLSWLLDRRAGNADAEDEDFEDLEETSSSPEPVHVTRDQD